MDYLDVINFWFHEIEPKAWWLKDAGFDNRIRNRFLETHQAATRAELYPWREQAQGRLAEVIVLDQFSRNMFRDSAKAFAYDALALVLAQEAVTAGVDQELDAAKRAFLYMPFMHSESPRIHEQAVQLFGQPGLEHNLEFELKHKAIVDRFGRYPHRNLILGRESTAEELEFLAGPDSSF